MVREGLAWVFVRYSGHYVGQEAKAKRRRLPLSRFRSRHAPKGRRHPQGAQLSEWHIHGPAWPPPA
jgi:endonuclease YncB( thermonuclease family)